MKSEPEYTTGIEQMVKTYRKNFQIPENQNHYSENDYKVAERKYLKFALESGQKLEIE